jgi:hypothetical protein
MYRHRVQEKVVKVLKSTSKKGALKSAKVAISESNYTVDLCLGFSARSCATSRHSTQLFANEAHALDQRRVTGPTH